MAREFLHSVLKVRMIRFITLSALLFGFASCKKDEKTEPAPVTKAAPTEVAEPVKPAQPVVDVFVIKAAKLSFEATEKNPDGPLSLSLDESGNVMANDKPFAKLSADGKITNSDGKVIASVGADGTLTSNGIDKAIVIAADGTITKAGKRFGSFSADGMLTIEGMSEKVTYEGPAEAKRALMALFVVSTMTGGEVIMGDPTAGEDTKTP